MRKNRNEVLEDIPVSLELAITGMSVIDRGEYETDDGRIENRLVLFWAGEFGPSSWYHGNGEETLKRIKAGWPGLSEGQLNQAMKMIRAKIKIALKTPNPFSAQQPRRSYMDMSDRPRGCFTLPGDEGYDY